MDNSEVDTAPEQQHAESDTRCFIAHLEDAAQLSVACDYGWIGIGGQSAADVLRVPEGAQRKSIVIVASVPQRRSVVGYGIVLGAVTKRADLKEAQRRDLPSYWTAVVRVGWVRVAEAPWEELGTSHPSTAELPTLLESSANRFTATVKPVSGKGRGVNIEHDAEDHPCFWEELRSGGDLVCASIDAASLKVLPHDLRELHLNPQAAAELADRNNQVQASRQHRTGGHRSGNHAHSHGHTYSNRTSHGHSHSHAHAHAQVPTSHAQPAVPAAHNQYFGYPPQAMPAAGAGQAPQSFPPTAAGQPGYDPQQQAYAQYYQQYYPPQTPQLTPEQTALYQQQLYMHYYQQQAQAQAQAQAQQPASASASAPAAPQAAHQPPPQN